MNRSSLALVVATLALQLLATGCLGNGSGNSSSGIGGFFSQLFGGGSNSSDALGPFVSTGGSSQGDAGTAGSGIGGPIPEVAHTPEPASLALFGGGLAGFTLLRRRKSLRRAPR